jgi:hypothetical protein
MGVAIAIVVALSIAAAVFVLSPTSFRSSTTIAAISNSPHLTPTSASGTNCLLSIPADAQMSLFANSTFYGDSVTYSNATHVFFSDYACPRPVLGGSSQGPNVYAMALAAENNSNFVLAENGSEFLLQEPSGLSCVIGTKGCSVTLFFYRYGGSATQFLCGSSLSGNGSKLFRIDPLAGITVTFKTTGGSDPNGIDSKGWDLRDPVIQTLSADQADLHYSNSYPCG